MGIYTLKMGIYSILGFMLMGKCPNANSLQSFKVSVRRRGTLAAGDG